MAALVGVSALILAVFSVPLISFVARVERDRLVTAMERDAFTLAGHAKETLNTSEGAVLPSLEPYVAAYAGSSSAEVVVTNSTGLAIASSDPTVTVGEDYSNRPEVSNALEGQPAVGERRSQTLGENLVFVAVPVLRGDEVLGVVRLSNPRSTVDAQVRRSIVAIVLVGVLTLVAAALLAVPLALTIAGPIRRLTLRTEKLAGGDFSVRAEDDAGPPEVRELSRSFNTMAGRLGAMIEGQRQFAGAVSHQLRTPLTALRLRLEQAQASVEGDERLGEALEASRNEADRLQAMVEQLLALARLEGGRASTVVVDAAAVVRDRADMWAALCDEKSVTLDVVAPEVAHCAVVEGALEQVVDNYIDNALSVAPSGSTITLSVARVGGRVVVEVVDHGPGLSPEHCEAAFERFWRGPGAEQGTGTGLGLAVVRQLALASGGDAWLSPEPGGGLRASASFVSR